MLGWVALAVFGGLGVGFVIVLQHAGIDRVLEFLGRTIWRVIKKPIDRGNDQG
jgi:hypothetical protein